MVSFLLIYSVYMLLIRCRNFVMLESQNILVDNIYLSSTSDDDQVFAVLDDASIT